MERTRTMVILLGLGVAGAGCGAQPGLTERDEIVVFHTRSALKAVALSDTPSQTLRQKVEDFYPSACFDSDSDDDGLPRALDDDEPGSDDDSDGGTVTLADGGSSDGGTDGGTDDRLRCRRCNRGPGTEGDFRLRVESDRAELARGRVFLRQGNELTVPTPDGSLVIVLSASTELQDGEPHPGSEIRAEGAMAEGSTNRLEASRVKVLCPAAPAIPDDQVPPDAQELPTGNPID